MFRGTFQVPNLNWNWQVKNFVFSIVAHVIGQKYQWNDWKNAKKACK